jgi:hypothetical protein
MSDARVAGSPAGTARVRSVGLHVTEFESPYSNAGFVSLQMRERG